MENFEKIKTKEKEPIADIKVDKATLEYWEKHGLKDEINDMVFGFEDLVPAGERFSIHSANFDSTGKFVEAAEHDFKKFMYPKETKNLKEKIKGVEDEVRKILLNFTFDELEFDVREPKLIKQEKIKEEDKELLVRYFKTNQPHILLGYDTIDWWLERKSR